MILFIKENMSYTFSFFVHKNYFGEFRIFLNAVFLEIIIQVLILQNTEEMFIDMCLFVSHYYLNEILI